MDEYELIKVYTTKDLNRAELLKCELDRVGIACQIDGANQGGLSGILDIGILVRARDADQARKFLSELEN